VCIKICPTANQHDADAQPTPQRHLSLRISFNGVLNRQASFLRKRSQQGSCDSSIAANGAGSRACSNAAPSVDERRLRLCIRMAAMRYIV